MSALAVSADFSISKIQEELESAKAAHTAAVNKLQEENARQIAEAESSRDALVAERESQLNE